MPIEILQADITTLDVDAIVNAANPGLLGGGGVDGAIHRAAGPRLLTACRALPAASAGVRCPPGQARITPGFDLPARWIIHTVGPVWHGGNRNEPAALSACYRNSVELAMRHGFHSMAFPAISCGVYGFPFELAAQIAVQTLQQAGADARAPARVVLCSFDDNTHAALRAALGDENHHTS